MPRNRKNQVKYYRTAKHKFFASKKEFNTVKDFINWKSQQSDMFLLECFNYLITLGDSQKPETFNIMNVDVKNIPEEYREFFTQYISVLNTSRCD